MLTSVVRQALSLALLLVLPELKFKKKISNSLEWKAIKKVINYKAAVLHVSRALRANNVPAFLLGVQLKAAFCSTHISVYSNPI